MLNLDPSCPTSNFEPHPLPLHLGRTPPQTTRLLYPLRTPSSSQRSTYRYSRWDPLDSTPRLESPATSGERGTLVPTPREARLSTLQDAGRVQRGAVLEKRRGNGTTVEGVGPECVVETAGWSEQVLLGADREGAGSWEKQRDRQHPTRMLRCLSSQIPDHSPFRRPTGCSRSRVLPLRRRLPSTLERFVPSLLASPPAGLGL